MTIKTEDEQVTVKEVVAKECNRCKKIIKLDDVWEWQEFFV